MILQNLYKTDVLKYLSLKFLLVFNVVLDIQNCQSYDIK